MIYKKLGNSDLEVSIISFGCWNIVGDDYWGPQEKNDSLKALLSAFDNGINFFDTAEIYGDGYSEELIAEALSDVRNEIIIASKVSTPNFTEEKLIKACEGSLKRLRTEWIDLYQLHWPNHEIPVHETLEALVKLKKQGKIREYGISNYGPQDFSECLEFLQHSILSNQLAYSILFRAIEYEILPVCLDQGISILSYSPLMQGLLTGKFKSPDNVPVARALTRHFSSERPKMFHNEDGAETETFEALRKISEISDKIGATMAEVSIAWLIAQKGITSVIVGGRNANQVKENARAAELILDNEIVEELSIITDPLKTKLGNNADMWMNDSRIK